MASPSSGRCCAINAWSPAMPSTPSGGRRRANSRPASSTSSTSWWFSARSSPTNNTHTLLSPVGQHGGRIQRPHGSVLTLGTPSHQPSLLLTNRQRPDPALELTSAPAAGELTHRRLRRTTLPHQQPAGTNPLGRVGDPVGVPGRTSQPHSAGEVAGPVQPGVVARPACLGVQFSQRGG